MNNHFEGLQPVYWVRPYWAVSLIIGVSLFFFILTPNASFIDSYGQQKYDTFVTSSIYLLLICIFVTGLWLGILFYEAQYRSYRDSPSHNMKAYPAFRRMAFSASTLSLIGHIVYFSNSGFTIGLFLEVLSGSKGAVYTLKESFEIVPGITSLMNLSWWWFAFVGYRVFVLRRPLGTLAFFLTLALVFLGFLKGIATNERRVIFEMALPVILSIVLLGDRRTQRDSLLMNLAPIIGVLTLALVFLATAYIRTWVNFWAYRTPGVGYFEWALTRLGGYYTAAMNNGVVVWLETSFKGVGIFSFSGIAKLPIVGDTIWGDGEFSSLTSEFHLNLMRYTDINYNNHGGIIAPVLDFGFLTAVPVILSTAFLIGFLYGGAIRKRLVFVLLYGLFFFGFLEITRVWWFFSPFVVLNLFFLVIFFLVDSFLPKLKDVGR